MEVERIYSEKTVDNEDYFHEFKFKRVFKNHTGGQEIRVISLVFDLHCGYMARVNWKNREDLVVSARTHDKSPENAINKSAWILRQLDKLIGLKLED